jgi:hypothetical protein
VPRDRGLGDLEDIGQVTDTELACSMQDIKHPETSLVTGSVKVRSQSHQAFVSKSLGTERTEKILTPIRLYTVLVVDLASGHSEYIKDLLYSGIVK